MKPMPVVSFVKLATVLGAATVLLSADELCAERVGYSFQGTLIQSGSPGNYTLFGYSVPKTSPVSGTFSYDTDTSGADGETGVQTYHQLIEGGYTMNINNGTIRLSASDYNITLTNDDGLPLLDSFIAGYTYDSTAIPPITPQQILVNGTPSTSTKAEIYLQLRWDPATFNDLKLTSDRPIIPGASLPDSLCLCADVRSSSTPRFFSVTLPLVPISPSPGDYNLDSKLDTSDYIEWRKAFGETQSQSLYADGNNNGIVDMADYVIWRKGMSTSATGAMLELNIPEPTGLLMSFASVAILAIRWRPMCNRAKSHLRKSTMTRVPLIVEGDRPSQSRRAVTLVELLAVIGILGVLVGLLLPAIQAARESSRANGCRNNLKQIGIALLNYESIHKHLPKGAEGRVDPKLAPVPMLGLSWWPEVLPHLEERGVADALDRTGAWTGWVQLNRHNGEVINGFAPAFWFCPSSSIDHFVTDDGFQVAAPSYVGISGATSHNGFLESRVSPCCRSDGEISAGGVLVPNMVIRSRKISDGLSNTLLVGEQSDFAYWQAFTKSMRIDGGYLRGWLAGTYAVGVPPNYGSSLAPSYNLATVRYALNERSYDLPGIYLDRGANNPLLSPHPRIVNLLYCDGSVHATMDSIDIVVLKSLATRDDGITVNE